MKILQYRIPAFFSMGVCWILTGILAIGVLSAVPLMAEGLLDEPDYTITGYSFDSDAVSESDSGLLFETSRFKPLMITNVTSDIFGENPFSSSLDAASSPMVPHGFAIAAEYLPTPSLAFHGAIGVTRGAWDDAASSDLQSSWEANIGVVYNFFNSLSYEVHFGYMDTGDLFQQVDTYSEIDSIIMVSNQLTLSF